MSPAIIVLVVVVLVLLLAGLVFWRPQMRRQRLRKRFGPEYDHVVRNSQNHDEAERELLARERRHKELDLRPLEPATREHYRAEWTAVQERFVDSPGGAASEADRLIMSIMTDRGYPAEGYEQRLADLSVKHAHVVGHYRRAHEIDSQATGDDSQATGDGASTEDLRQALVHYRAIFNELLGGQEDAVVRPRRVADGDGHRTAAKAPADEAAERRR